MQALIHSMKLFPFLMINGFLLLAAGIAIAAGLKARRQAAILKSTPTSNIGMAEDGYREFEGTIEAIDGRSAVAPLTQSPCAWYRATLEQWTRSSSQHETRWHTVRSVTSDVPFLLRDSTGVCLVEPFLADVTPTDRSRWTGAGEAPTERNPPRIGPTQSFESVEIAGTANTNYRYTEERIYVGDPLLVLGDFKSRSFDQFEDEEDEEDEENDEEADDGESLTGEEDDPGARAWDDSALADDLRTRATAITSAHIGHGGGRGQPFMMTTTPQATHVYMSDVGSQVAFYGSLVPIGIVALMLYARYG